MEILYMHELTLLFGVAEQVGRVAKENNIDHVDAVVLEIGELTTVVPEFMMDGYPVISDEYDFLRGSELIIDTVPAIGHCNEIINNAITNAIVQACSNILRLSFHRSAPKA